MSGSTVSTAPRPYVTAHADVSLDGATTGFEPDRARSQELLAAVLAELGRRGARRVRVDSGGALTGALLRAGLLDEISLLVHPVWCGARAGPRWYGEAAGPPAGLSLVANRSVGDGLVWLYYRTGA